MCNPFDVPPPSRKDLEEAQTQKPPETKKLLDDLLKSSSRLSAALGNFFAWHPLGDAKIEDDLAAASIEFKSALSSVQRALGPRVHALKADPMPFAWVKARLKKYEIRKFDRDFHVGDEVKLLEYDRETARYSGDWVRARITTMTKPGEYGLPSMLGVLGIEVFEAKGERSGEVGEDPR